MLFRSVKILILLSLILIIYVQQASAVAPVITLLNQTPSVLYGNSTGNFSLLYGIEHDNSGLNLTSLAIKWTTFGGDSNTYYHSIRVPNNNRSDEWNDRFIARADNRNRTGTERLNCEDNVTITEGNAYKWAGVDENSSRTTIVPVNSTYTKVYLNGTFQDIVANDMWYLCRHELINVTKSQFEITKHVDLVVKLYDSEIMKGNNNDYVTKIWLGTNIPGNIPSTILEVYWGNYSWDPEGTVNIEDSPYGIYITSFGSSEWVNWIYQPDTNANYISFEIGANYSIGGIKPTNESYLVFKCLANTNAGFGIDMADADSCSNVSFANTNVAWTGTDSEYSQYSYTPNIFITFHRENQVFKSMCYVQDNLGAWNNSTIHESAIESGKYPPTSPSCAHFSFAGMEDINKDCTYRETLGLQMYTSTDPDGGDVFHNLTFIYANGTHIATVNNTFNNTDGESVNISFDTTPYYSTVNMYKFKCVVIDDENEVVLRQLAVNFSLSPLGTTGIIKDTNRVVFWGVANLSEIYNTVSDNDYISFYDGHYYFNKSVHMSQYADSFTTSENIRIKSTASDIYYFRFTGNGIMTNAKITSWNWSTSDFADITDTYRSFIYSDAYYSHINITNSNLSYLGKGEYEVSGIYLKGDTTLVDNNTISYNQLGIYVVGDNITVSNNNINNNVDQGIRLTNVEGCSIINNVVYNNTDHGIRLDYCDDIDISDNKIYDNTEHGIRIDYSYNIDFVNNVVYNNTDHGLRVHTSELIPSENYSFIDNTFYYNTGHGLSISRVNNTIYSNNLFYNNTEYGVRVQSGINCTFINNEFNNNTEYGLSIRDVNDLSVYNNDFDANTIRSLRIENIENGDIYNNVMINTEKYGIKGVSLNNVSIHNNAFSGEGYIHLTSGVPFDNFATAIDVETSNKCDIYNNSITGARYSIYLTNHDNSFIQNNNIFNCRQGITIRESDNATITDNVVDYSLYLDLYVKNTNDSIISDNVGIGCTEYGIYIQGSNNNMFANNSVDMISGVTYVLTSGSLNNTIRDPRDTIDTVGVRDAVSEVTIENTNGQVFIESSSGTTYGYVNDTFRLFTNVQEDFVIVNTPYIAKFMSLSQLTASTPSATNVASFVINSGNVSSIEVYNVQDNTNYIFKQGSVTLQIIKSSGNIILFTENIGPGSYTIGLTEGALSGIAILDNVYRGFEFGSIGLIVIGVILLMMVILLMLLAFSGKVEIGYTAVITMTGILCASAVAFGLFLYVMGYIT